MSCVAQMFGMTKEGEDTDGAGLSGGVFGVASDTGCISCEARGGDDSPCVIEGGFDGVVCVADCESAGVDRVIGRGGTLSGI